MNMKFDNNLYRQAMLVLGYKQQSLIAMEECSELCQAISKCIRYYDSRNYNNKGNDKHIDNLAEEMADVLIMIEQLKEIYNVNEQDIQEWINKKEERLKENLKKTDDNIIYAVSRIDRL